MPVGPELIAGGKTAVWFALQTPKLAKPARARAAKSAALAYAAARGPVRPRPAVARGRLASRSRTVAMGIIVPRNFVAKPV